MKLPGYQILEEITRRREVTLGEACEMLPRKFSDHRDFYVLASLYTGGLIETSLKPDGCNWDTNKINLVAEELFVMSLGPGTFEPDGIAKFTCEHDYRETFKLFCTAKADLLFEQYRRTRIERLSALAVGIIVGLVSAFAGAYARTLFLN